MEQSSSCNNLDRLLAIPPIGNTILHHLELDHQDLPAIRFTSRAMYRCIRHHVISKKNKEDYNKKEKIDFTNFYWLEDCRLLEATTITNTDRQQELHELYLAGCWNLTTHGLSLAITAIGRTLVRISLAQIFSLEDRVVAVIGEQCHQLQWLCLRECWRITDDGVR